MAHYLYSAIASAIDARKRCKETNNTVWIDNWTEAIKRAEREYLPRGSGIDGGTKIDPEHSHANKIVLTFDFHHMDDSGYYRDWNWADVQGRHLVMSMGNPLEPGTYYIGVKDHGSGQPCSYTLASRGIGAGLSIPVGELAFSNGVVSGSSLPAWEAAFYRVEVPSNAPSWKLRLAADAGDTLLMMRYFSARSEFQEPNTAWMERSSCSHGSCGNGFLTFC